MMFAARSIRHMIAGPVTVFVYLWYCAAFLARARFGNVPYVILGVPFVPINIAYNWIVGSFIFWELPREGGYTGRIKRHIREGCYFALHIGRLLNWADPEHVDLQEFGRDRVE